jgi:hypothetical protein
LDPGKSVLVELASNRNLSGHLKANQPHYMSADGWNRDNKINRADLLLSLMFHESEPTLASEHVLGNGQLHELDLTGQLALDRPMLVARIDRAGARLDLDNVPSPPKIDQLTLVRLILPIKGL